MPLWGGEDDQGCGGDGSEVEGDVLEGLEVLDQGVGPLSQSSHGGDQPARAIWCRGRGVGFLARTLMLMPVSVWLLSARVGSPSEAARYSAGRVRARAAVTVVG